MAREDLFITSKLFPQSYPYARYGKDIDATLERLGTDYVDLLLLHQPYGEYVSGRRAMDEAVEAGGVRAIGLSSSSAAKVREVLGPHGPVPRLRADPLRGARTPLDE